MTEVLTVPTSFGDLSELSQGLADRVEEERIILYGPASYTEGDTVGFAVLLVDSTPALEGYGRIAAVVDGGDQRDPETRYDIVFESLQLAGRSEVVYERIILARQSLMGEEPSTGEVDVSELHDEVYFDASVDVASMPPEAADDEAVETGYAAEPTGGFEIDEADVYEPVAYEAPAEVHAEALDESVEDVFDELEAEPMGFEEVEGEGLDYGAEYGADDGVAEDETIVGTVDEFSPVHAVAAPEPPQAPGGFDLARSEGPLARPIHNASWWPVAPPAPEPRESTGWFQYAAGELPVPAHPPRPELPPDMQVSPAPRPRDAGEAPDPVPRRKEQIPLPDPDESDVAPAVEPDYVSIGDVSISDVGDADDEEASFDGASFDDGAEHDAQVADALEAFPVVDLGVDDAGAVAEAISGEDLADMVEESPESVPPHDEFEDFDSDYDETPR